MDDKTFAKVLAELHRDFLDQFGDPERREDSTAGQIVACMESRQRHKDDTGWTYQVASPGMVSYWTYTERLGEFETKTTRIDDK